MEISSNTHGKYWEEGMKIGYQDCGAWTIPVTTDPEKEKQLGYGHNFVPVKLLMWKSLLQELLL